MLLLKEYIKSLNQFTKKKRSVFEATADGFFYHFWQNIFSCYFSVTLKFLLTLALCKVSEKGTNRFGLIHRAKDRNSNIFGEKLVM